MTYSPKGQRYIQRYFGQKPRLETQFTPAYYKEVWGQRMIDLANHIKVLNQMLQAKGVMPADIPPIKLATHDEEVEKITLARDNALKAKKIAEDALAAYIKKTATTGGLGSA